MRLAVIGISPVKQRENLRKQLKVFNRYFTRIRNDLEDYGGVQRHDQEGSFP